MLSLVLRQNILGRINFRSFIEKKASQKLEKKEGLDKLLITLVLMAVGLGLCIIFRNTVYSTMSTSLTTLGTKINDLMSGTVTNPTTTTPTKG